MRLPDTSYKFSLDEQCYKIFDWVLKFLDANRSVLVDNHSAGSIKYAYYHISKIAESLRGIDTDTVSYFFLANELRKNKMPFKVVSGNYRSGISN